METLAGKRIGVDVDAETAFAELEAIDAKLAELGSRSPNVQVRSDIATARAELAQMQHLVNDLDRDDVHISVRANTAQAQGALMQLAVALGAVAALPVIPIAAAGIGAIASAAVAATAGVGALALAAIPAIKGVTSAIQAKNAAEKESASASDSSAAAGKRAAQSAMQMASAQASLRSAHRQAATQIATASRQVEDAERALGQAAARAMEQRRDAAEAVERAEKSLIDAKRQAKTAEEDLTRARKDAAQQLEDLQDRLASGALDQRDAALRVQEAQEELNRTLADPTSTELQRQRARLAYEESVQGQKRQQREYARLKDEAAAASKAGIDGNEGVKRAADQLADAQDNVREQTDAVADAQREAAKAQKDAAQTVADAQRRMADAVQEAADAQVQAAESIATAERGVASARLSSIDTTAQATSKADEYRETLAKLSPAQRDLYDSLAGPGGLIDAYKEWAKSLQPDVLPLFTRMVDGAKNSLPGLTPLVKNSADAVGELMDRASADLKSPFWQRFKKGVEESAKPAIVGLGVAFGNIFKGMAGILDAFFPHMEDISDRMQSITERFADWGTGLRGSPEFEKFLDYVSEHGSTVGEAFGDMAEAIIDVAKALEPFSRVILELVGYAADAISYVAENAPWAIQLLYGLWVATKLWTLAMAASPVGLVIAGLIGLALAVKYAWDHFEWFRDIVTACWEGIQDAAKWAWEKVLQPTFTGLRDGIKWVGDQLVWLWQDIFVPVWDFISLVVRTAVAVILTVAITPLVLAIQGVGLLIGWLWTDCFKPTWDAIAAASSWLWNNILAPFFKWIWGGIKWVGDQFVWLYEHAIRPAFDWISGKASWLWSSALQPTFRWIWDGLKWVGDKFRWLYDHSVSPVAGWIADKSDWLWEKGLKPAFDLIKDGIGLVGDAFEDAKKTIKSAWDSVARIAATPVNWIISTVYTNGVKAVWDKVADFLHLGHLPNAPKLLAPPEKFAQGGRTKGGIPGKDSIPILAMADEFIIKRDSARKIGFDKLAYMNATGDIPRFKDGGVVGAIGGAWDWTKDKVGSAVSKGIDWAKELGDLISDPSKIWGRLTKPIMDNVRSHMPGGGLGSMLTAIPSKMIGGLKDMIVSTVAGMFDGGGGVGQWAKPVNAPYGTKFGVAGSMWSSGHHTGLDFPAAVGTLVRAVAGGTVSGVGTAGPYGNHIEIDHGGKLQSLYAHLSKMSVGLGQIVAQGDPIGKVGATGNVTGPHLHLEARLRGKAVDPMPYLTSARAGTKIGQAVASAKMFAKGRLNYFGWGPGEFAPLERLWEGESNWRWNAKNPSSGAYGIPQALPASKMASAGPDWKTNPATQILWGLRYIKDRPDYGSPSKAYQKWLSRSPHWYDDGGYLPPGLSLVANGTGRPEPVFTGSQWDDIRAARNGGPNVQVDVYSTTVLDGQELKGVVDTRIEMHGAEAANNINNGRYV
jgi:phage-related protein